MYETEEVMINVFLMGLILFCPTSKKETKREKKCGCYPILIWKKKKLTQKKG